MSYDKPVRSKDLKMFQKDGSVCLSIGDSKEYYVAPDAVLAVLALCDGSRNTVEIVGDLLKTNKTTTVDVKLLTKSVRDAIHLLRTMKFVE